MLVTRWIFTLSFRNIFNFLMIAMTRCSRYIPIPRAINAAENMMTASPITSSVSRRRV